MKYLCEICGKSFKTELDCLKHEKEHATKMNNLKEIENKYSEIITLVDKYYADFGELPCMKLQGKNEKIIKISFEFTKED